MIGQVRPGTGIDSEMENLFIILRLVRQYKLGRKGRSSRPGPARAPAAVTMIMARPPGILTRMLRPAAAGPESGQAAAAAAAAAPAASESETVPPPPSPTD